MLVQIFATDKWGRKKGGSSQSRLDEFGMDFD